MRSLDWDAADWGGHVHIATSGTWLDAEEACDQ